MTCNEWSELTNDEETWYFGLLEDEGCALLTTEDDQDFWIEGE